MAFRRQLSHAERWVSCQNFSRSLWFDQFRTVGDWSVWLRSPSERRTWTLIPEKPPADYFARVMSQLMLKKEHAADMFCFTCCRNTGIFGWVFLKLCFFPQNIRIFLAWFKGSGLLGGDRVCVAHQTDNVYVCKRCLVCTYAFRYIYIYTYIYIYIYIWKRDDMTYDIDALHVSMVVGVSAVYVYVSATLYVPFGCGLLWCWHSGIYPLSCMHMCVCVLCAKCMTYLLVAACCDVDTQGSTQTGWQS